jgi:SAM-dependent methyltransferase
VGCGCGKRGRGLARLAARESPAPHEWNDVALARALGSIHPSGAASEAAFTMSGVEAARAIAELLPLAEYPTLIDFGAGVGRVARPLHDLGYRVVAVDAMPAMVKAGRQRCGECEWIQDDGLDLARQVKPLADAAVALAVFPHMPYKAGRRVLSGLAAAVRSGGAVALQIPLYDVARQPRDWIDVGVWTLDLLRVTADQAGLVVEQASTNPGEFSYAAVGENHGRLHLLRRI